MKKIIENEDYKQVLARPEGFQLHHREIIIAYKVIQKEMAEELETMPANEAIRLFKDVLLRLV